jgi:branched-chain amino acid transport system ATP-binding protein
MSMLEVNDLHVRYDSIAALQGVSIEVGAGEIVGIVGPNGAGKSSLLLSITGAVKPADGSISFEENDVTGQKPEDVVRKGIALVPEGREIFGELTVEENLRLGATIQTDRRMLQEDVARYMAAFPILEERRASRAEKLSGGEQQMLAIARALMGRPRLLLLDEPSLGLAPLITKQVYDTLVSLNQDGMTVLVVEQNPARIIKVASRVYVLRSGRVVRSGPAEILNQREELDDAYFGYDTREEQAP